MFSSIISTKERIIDDINVISKESDESENESIAVPYQSDAISLNDEEYLSVEDYFQSLLEKPLCARSMELIARSFILGVVMADSTQNRKRKRTLKQDIEREIVAHDIEMQHLVKNTEDSSVTETDCCFQEHPLLQELQETVLEW